MRNNYTARTVACAVCIMICTLITGMAFASSEEVSPSDAIEEPISYEYEIVITPPEGWYDTSAAVRVEIRDIHDVGYDNAACQRPGEESWTTIQNGADSVAITENGTFTVRLYDPGGGLHEESLYIECFDRTAPSVTAGIRDRVLHAEATDTQSGVYAIMVDGNLYTTLQNCEMDLRLKDYADAGPTLAVLAIDNIGNRSDVTTIDNPYYTTPTPEPTATSAPAATPKPTETPAETHPPVIIYTGSLEDTRTTPSVTAAPVQVQTQASAPSVPASTTVTSTAPPAAADEPDPMPAETSAPEEITIEPGDGFSEHGNAVTRDLLYDKHTNKQFVTVETRNGNIFYLVIDYDKVSDEDEELYQTYFLNPVDESDLLALLDDDAISALTTSEEQPQETPAVCSCADKCAVGHIDTTCPVCRADMTQCMGVESTPEPTLTPEPEEPEEPLEEKTSGSGAGGVAAVILLLAMIGGGAYYFLKVRKQKPDTRGNTEFEDYFDDYDEDEDNNDTEEGDEEDAGDDIE